jgi:K+-transporting ATPase ATPase C chain
MNDILASLRLCVLSLLACSVAYPAAILAFAAVAVPESREGSLLQDATGAVVGSRLLAQEFTQPRYFWPRPSACQYNASATGGSNLSPTNPELTARARQTLEHLAPPAGALVPADLVTASGSGMDPHITLAAAMFQAPRVAVARNLPREQVESLIREHADSPTIVSLGGEPLINVLELNLALDQAAGSSPVQ